MEKTKILKEYQTPVIETVLVFDNVYTDGFFEASQDVGEQYPWD